MRLEPKALGALSQVCRDICGRVRMKYYYNYQFCVPPMGLSWWRLADETAVIIGVCEDCFRDYLEASIETGAAIRGKATKGFCLEIKGVPLVVVLTYRYRAESFGAAERMGRDRIETTTVYKDKEEDDDDGTGREEDEPEEDVVGREGDENEEYNDEVVDRESIDSRLTDKTEQILITNMAHLATQIHWGNNSSEYQRFYYADDVSIASDSTAADDITWDDIDEPDQSYEEEYYNYTPMITPRKADDSSFESDSDDDPEPLSLDPWKD